MLRLRIRFLLNSKGIVNPYNYLKNIGFTPNVASRVLNGHVNCLKITQISRLCTELQCTPSDLFEYVPSTGEALQDKHPLLSLVRNDKPFNIIGQINHLSFDQIKEVEDLISNLKKEKLS